MRSITPGAFGLPRPAAQLWLDPRQIELLRLLGRLEMMSSRQIYAMVYEASVTRRTMQRHLEQLHADGKIWQSTVRYNALPGNTGKRGPPHKYPYIYGLTPEGKTLLGSLGIEHDQRTLDGLRCREPRGRRISAPTIAHDMVVSWWCSSILMAVKGSRLCTEVFVQSEFTIHEKQRFDALVVLRLNPERPRAAAGSIPWFEGRPCPPEAMEIRLGLEVDMATEALSILAGKAAVTRDLHSAGLYQELFGGPVRSVFLVPTKLRASQIAAEWRRAWPESWGVIATTSSAEHATHGTLWGDYRTMSDGTQSVSLLDELIEGADRRVRRRRTVTIKEWMASLDDVSGDH